MTRRVNVVAPRRRVAAAGRREPDEDLVQDDVVEDRRARRVAQPVGHPPGQRAAAIDQLRKPLAAQLAQRRVDRERREPPRRLGDPVVRSRARRPRLRRSTPRRSVIAAWCASGVADDRDARSRTARSATCGRRSSTSPRRRGRPSGGGAPGDAAAHSPNAPSTWSHAFGSSRTAATISGSGSNAPVFTLPDWAQTRTGRSRDARRAPRAGASARIRPWSSASTRSDAGSPSPSIWSETWIVDVGLGAERRRRSPARRSARPPRRSSRARSARDGGRPRAP